MKTQIKISPFFFVAVFFIFISAAIAIQNIVDFNAGTRNVARSHQVIGLLYKNLTDIKDIESGLRGYVITGDNKFLSNSNFTLESLQTNRKQLRNLIGENAITQKRLDTIEELCIEKIAFTKQVFLAREYAGFGEAKKMILSEKGKKLMDSITEVSLRLEQNEQRALESAISDKENSFKFIEIFGICGIVFSIIVAIGFLIILQQTTRLQKSLKESDKFFNISLDLLCIVDSKYFIKVNPAFTALLGYDEKVLLSKPFLTFVHPDDLQPSTTESKKIEEKVAVHHFINRFRKKDGSYLWIDWVTAPDPKKQLAYVVGHDITEMKHVEEELIHSREKAEQLLINLETSQIKVVANEKMAAFGVMASRVGHEILNPLNFVNNFSEISEELAKEIISSESDKVRNEAAQMLLLNVQKIKEHGKHAAEIIQKLQERTRAGKAYEFFEKNKSNEV